MKKVVFWFWELNDLSISYIDHHKEYIKHIRMEKDCEHYCPRLIHKYKARYHYEKMTALADVIPIRVVLFYIKNMQG